MLKRFLKDNRGVSAVFFGLTLPISAGFLALGSETALWFYKQRELQKIVDIAAYNGAVELSDSDNPTSAEQTAQKDAIFHGFDASTGRLRMLEAMRYKEATDDTPVLWINEVQGWQAFHGLQIPSPATVTWLDEGTPWSTWDHEDVVYNADVSDHIRARGP